MARKPEVAGHPAGDPTGDPAGDPAGGPASGPTGGPAGGPVGGGTNCQEKRRGAAWHPAELTPLMSAKGQL